MWLDNVSQASSANSHDVSLLIIFSGHESMVTPFIIPQEYSNLINFRTKHPLVTLLCLPEHSFYLSFSLDFSTVKQYMCTYFETIKKNECNICSYHSYYCCSVESSASERQYAIKSEHALLTVTVKTALLVHGPHIEEQGCGA